MLVRFQLSPRPPYSSWRPLLNENLRARRYLTAITPKLRSIPRLQFLCDGRVLLLHKGCHIMTSTRTYQKFLGYTVEDCSCQSCLYNKKAAGRRRSQCTFDKDKCCCERERATAYMAEAIGVMLSAPPVPAHKMQYISR